MVISASCPFECLPQLLVALRWEKFAKIPEVASFYDPNGIHGVSLVIKDMVALAHSCQRLRSITLSQGPKACDKLLSIPSLENIKGLESPEQLVLDPESVKELNSPALLTVCNTLQVYSCGSNSSKIFLLGVAVGLYNIFYQEWLTVSQPFSRPQAHSSFCPPRP